ncbi:hypothetical protein [Synergistes jonesii]|uniref:Uncharacterized protein n=1 Tax=Synergistes jonesii TaxID=2754 RepID=A0A073ISY6_9BACT|nr:hypothetical protein [Synergistes jonesii]KEJ93453.1 hypothetical protein EH55_01355 [Synergistes jonesii]
MTTPTRTAAMTAPTRDTHANWTANNPIVPEGVLCITKDRNYAGSTEYFIGDGVNVYNNLMKFGVSPDSINAVTSIVERFSYIYPMNRNGIYRGKNLGVTVRSVNDMEAFLTEHEVGAGRFKNLFLGDYFKIEDGTYNLNWTIAGFDTRYLYGDTPMAAHHLVMLPKGALGTAPMNGTNTTAGGYAGSQMWTTTIPDRVSRLDSVLGTHLLTDRRWLSNAVDTNAVAAGLPTMMGAASAYDVYDVRATLLSEVELFGTKIFGSSGADVLDANQRLPLFNFINFRQVVNGTWLRDVVSTTRFARCTGYGLSAHGSAESASNLCLQILLG